jgi:hypothetical protein
LRATLITVLRQPSQPVSCLLSSKNVPSLTKAVKQPNGHLNSVHQGAAGGVAQFRRMPRERTFWCALEIASPCCRPKVTTYAYSTRNREISARLRYMPSSYTLTILGCCSSSRKNTCSCKSCIQALHNRAVRPCVASRACNSWLQSTQSCWTGTMRMSVIDVYYE